MKPFFLKYLWVDKNIEDFKKDINPGDMIIQYAHGMYSHVHKERFGHGWSDPFPAEFTGVKALWKLAPKEDIKKVDLFLCTTDVKVGNKTFPFLGGHMDDIGNGPFADGVDFDCDKSSSGWPDEPHTILDLNHSEYKPYRVRTDYGYGPPGLYVKVLGIISQDAKVWATEKMEFDDTEWRGPIKNTENAKARYFIELKNPETGLFC